MTGQERQVKKRVEDENTEAIGIRKSVLRQLKGEYNERAKKKQPNTQKQKKKKKTTGFYVEVKT